MLNKAPETQDESTKPAQHLVAVLVAAGSGSRMGGELPKQFQDFAGQPLFAHSLRTLQESGLVEHVVLVVPAGWEAKIEQQLQGAAVQVDAIVAGGATRQQSVQHGLATIGKQAWPATHVLIHDAARPFVSLEMVRSVVAAVHETGAATLAIPVSDTLMRAAESTSAANDQSAQAEELVDRSGMWAIQTPQVFELTLLLEAHQHATTASQATDDGSLVLELGRKLHFVQGAWWNIKVTHPDDFEKARLIAAIRRLPATQFPDTAASESASERGGET